MSGLRAAFERHLVAGWYGSGPLLWALPLTGLYWLGAGLARLLRGPARRVGRPVVVVGNVTAGGSGKTPLVLHLVEQLRAAGRRPGIVTRGHGRTSSGVALVQAASTAAQVGDEPLLLARRAGCPVMVGADRVAAAEALLAAHPEIDVIVSDDGLQHARLARDAEVLVVDAARGFGNGWLLPAGPLREAPGPVLARASAVVSNGAAPAGLLDAAGAAPVTMRLEPGAAVQLSDGATQPLAAFAATEVHAIAGIGNPERFFTMLEALGLRLRRHPRPDHAPLSPADLGFGDGLPVLLTEKDAVKLPRDMPGGVWCVPVTARFAADDAGRLLAQVLPRLAAARP
jgi:tetraacyldisaccharide 4'-kinase